MRLPNAATFAQGGSYIYCHFALFRTTGRTPPISATSPVHSPKIDRDHTAAEAAVEAFTKFVSQKYCVKGSPGCSTRAARRINRRGSNRHRMKSQWQVTGNYESSRQLNIQVHGEWHGPYEIGGVAYTIQTG